MASSDEKDPPRLSDLADPVPEAIDGESLSRRLFLRRATIAGAAVAVTGCAPGEENAGGAQVPVLDDPTRTSSSRADSALDLEHSPQSHTAAIATASAAPYQRYDPVL